MAARDEELRDLADRLGEFDGVADAFLAKSFTDRLLIVDVREDDAVPEGAVELLAAHGLRGANDVYENAGADHSSTGEVGGRERHHFVDVQTRGSHQSYVVD